MGKNRFWFEAVVAQLKGKQFLESVQAKFTDPFFVFSLKAYVSPNMGSNGCLRIFCCVSQFHRKCQNRIRSLGRVFHMHKSSFIVHFICLSLLYTCCLCAWDRLTSAVSYCSSFATFRTAMFIFENDFKRNLLWIRNGITVWQCAAIEPKEGPDLDSLE